MSPSLRRRLRMFKNALPYRFLFLRTWARRGFRAPTVLFYPETPRYWHLLYKYARSRGYHISKDLRARAILCVHFEDTTTKTRDTVLTDLNQRGRMVNYDCTDISKSRVDAIAADVFGYSISLDPRTHSGSYVRKSELNAAHDGVVLSAPSDAEPGFVYQRLIDNRVDDGNIVDIRVIVVGRDLPFIFLKYRPIGKRFDAGAASSELKETNAVIWPDEERMILEVCRRMGVDCGALDVLRDRNDGRLYVVDVNDTPSGPPPGLPPSQRKQSLRRLYDAFDATFLPPDAVPERRTEAAALSESRSERRAR